MNDPVEKLPEKASVETFPTRAADPKTDKPASPRSADRQWRQLAVACLALLALLNGGLALYAFSSLAELREGIDHSLWRSEHRYQSLDSQIRFDSRRRQLLLALRDEILATNPGLDWAEAYRYAALAMSASEKYASLDPVFLLSVGIVESGFDEAAESVAGARGLYQLFPSTARLLSRSLGWEYTSEVLFDPAKNTEMASLYLETLFAVHRDPRIVLAEYREGALEAGYLSANVRELDGDVRRYVSRVMDTYEELVSKYGSLRGLSDAVLMPAWQSEPVPLLDDGARVGGAQ